jgi:stage V sporulation protein G
MNMQITEITVHPTHDGLVRAYVNIVFDNCFMIREIRVIRGPTGLFVSFPARKQREGTHWDIAYPANAETRHMIEQAVLTEYEKVVAGSEPVASLVAPPPCRQGLGDGRASSSSGLSSRHRSKPASVR